MCFLLLHVTSVQLPPPPPLALQTVSSAAKSTPTVDETQVWFQFNHNIVKISYCCILYIHFCLYILSYSAALWMFLIWFSLHSRKTAGHFHQLKEAKGGNYLGLAFWRVHLMYEMTQDIYMDWLTGEYPFSYELNAEREAHFCRHNYLHFFRNGHNYLDKS
jgi:hypothetical protein